MEDPLFLAKDVAEWIDYAWTSKSQSARDVSKMLKYVDEEEKLLETIFLSGQNRKAWFLTEDGIYETIMQSRKPIAKQWKKEVKKILKQIRLTGGTVQTDREEEPPCKLARLVKTQDQPSRVAGLIDEDEKGLYNVNTLGGNQEA